MCVLVHLSKGTLSSPAGSYYHQGKTGGQVTKHIKLTLEGSLLSLVEVIIMKLNLEAHFCNYLNKRSSDSVFIKKEN